MDTDSNKELIYSIQHAESESQRRGHLDVLADKFDEGGVGKLVDTIIKNEYNGSKSNEDIKQDVWVKLQKEIKTFEGEGKFESWLVRVVKSCILDEYKNQDTQKRGGDWDRIIFEKSSIEEEAPKIDAKYSTKSGNISGSKLLRTLKVIHDEIDLIFKELTESEKKVVKAELELIITNYAGWSDDLSIEEDPEILLFSNKLLAAKTGMKTGQISTYKNRAKDKFEKSIHEISTRIVKAK